ncbi:MAG: ribonuclease R, partial [Halieaceae bacterium]
DEPSPLDYCRLQQQLGGRDDAHIISIMMLRSFKQAMYQPDNKGHFGLHYAAYAHFTSPIRRYPDLLVHRAIRSVIRSKASSKAVKRIAGVKPIPREEIYPYNLPAMLAQGEHCSMAERRADEATRDVDSWLKCEYLQEHVGEVFTGVVSATTSFGLFVELDGLYVEGLVHISALPGDYYHFDPVRQRLSGERSGRSFHLGDKVTVQIARVDLEDKKVDLEMVDKDGVKRDGAAKQGKKPATGGKPRKRKPKAGAGDKKGGPVEGKPKAKPKAKQNAKPKAKTKAKTKANVNKGADKTASANKLRRPKR